MELFAIIVAGGNGSRMNSNIPKQFMLLNKVPVLIHTLQKFIDFNPGINLVLVLPENQFDAWKKLCLEYKFELKYKLVGGGENRFSSVLNGLNSIETKKGIVFIHDGVRPLVSNSTIQRCFETTIEKGNAVPVMPLIESLRIVEGEINSSVERSKYVSIQTPQSFLLNEIKAAYSMGYDPLFTDDASVLERMGKTINLIEGNRENIKITEPHDLIIAEVLFNSKLK